MGFENSKNAAQFPFMQPKNTSLVPNTTPFIDFGLNLLATGRVEPTIRISVVMPFVTLWIFRFLIGCKCKISLYITSETDFFVSSNNFLPYSIKWDIERAEINCLILHSDFPSLWMGIAISKLRGTWHYREGSDKSSDTRKVKIESTVCTNTWSNLRRQLLNPYLITGW